MGKQKEFQLIITSIVAIVAVVGLVVNFGGASGAYTITWSSPRASTTQIGVDPAFQNYGYNVVAPSCISKTKFAEGRRCCMDTCQDWCSGRDARVSGRTASECKDACENGCDLGRRELVQTA